jgi:hypothetical protein
VLIHNLNLSLFNEIFTTALGSLDAAFEQFKKSLNYAILKEDIKRQEKLYEVMIEGEFIANT